MNFKEVALQYIENGLCTLPAIRSQKRPMCKWAKYQHELPTAMEWEGWQIADALCIVCGKISGNLLMMDFDQQGKALPDFQRKINPELYNRLVIEQSQSGGFHLIVRSVAPVQGMIEANVLLGSTVCTDEHKSYDGLDTIAGKKYVHKRVNHSAKGQNRDPVNYLTGIIPAPYLWENWAISQLRSKEGKRSRGFSVDSWAESPINRKGATFLRWEC